MVPFRATLLISCRRFAKMQAVGDRERVLAIDSSCKLTEAPAECLLLKSSLLLIWTSCGFEAATPHHMVATHSAGSIRKTGIAAGRNYCPSPPSEGVACWWWCLPLRHAACEGFHGWHPSCTIEEVLAKQILRHPNWQEHKTRTPNSSNFRPSRASIFLAPWHDAQSRQETVCGTQKRVAKKWLCNRMQCIGGGDSAVAARLADFDFFIDDFHAAKFSGEWCKEIRVPSLPRNKHVVKNFPTEIAESVNALFSSLGHCFHHHGPWFAQFVLQKLVDVHNFWRPQSLNHVREETRAGGCSKCHW